MSDLTHDERHALEDAGQGHLAAWVDAVDGEDRRTLLEDVRSLDLELVRDLVKRFVEEDEADDDIGSIEPPEAIPLPDSDAEQAEKDAAVEDGVQFLRDGRLALVLLAGGQGSRLGFAGPKGNFPYGPVTGKTLYHQHAHKVAALRSRYDADLPLYLLTSPGNHAATRDAFEQANFFGLEPDSVRFVVQGTMPAVDRDTGRVLRTSRGRLALSPDGHGGLLMALQRSGALDEMTAAGISTFFTFQVDNPLIRVANPGFIGHHLRAKAEMSNLAVRKHDPEEKVGVIARVDGTTVVVEYSDLPDALAERREADGTLSLWAANIATHLIEVDFVRRLTQDGLRLPFHRALKRVRHLDDDGNLRDPEDPNAIKFETFIFDALAQARGSVTVEVDRATDFSPIKNAEGRDSAETCRRDCNRLYARWLESAGVEVPRDEGGEPLHDLEIDPLLALDAAQLRQRLPANLTITGPTVLYGDSGAIDVRD